MPQSHMNHTTGIGGYSHGRDDSLSHEVGTQANTANPFKKTIIDVLQSRNVPSLQALETLLGQLANAEDKLHAIACGMIPALFKIYDQCHSSDETESIRVVVVHMLRSFMILQRGRQVMLEVLGLAKILDKWLVDPSAKVRQGVCELLATLCSFPDMKTVIVNKERLILLALVKTFLHDPVTDVTDAAIPALQQVTNYDPLLDEETLHKLAAVIVRTSAHAQERVPLALLKSTLQVVWNCSLHSKEKEIAIKVGLVEVIVPLLENHRSDVETVRCATGVLSSLAIDQKGKRAIINQPGAIAQVCKYTLDKPLATSSPIHAAVRANSVQLIRNFTEAPDGLHKVGKFLIPEPEVLLEVLGEVQTANILAPRFAMRFYESIDDDDTSTPVIDTTDLLWTVRALLALLKHGSAGLDAAWGILDIVPKLYECVIYKPTRRPAPNQVATFNESLTSIHTAGSRCLLLLCQENNDARLELHALEKRLAEDKSKASTITGAGVEIFALVEGAHLKQQQAREALEAEQRQREEEEERKRQLERERQRLIEEEEAAAAEKKRVEEEARLKAEEEEKQAQEATATEPTPTEP